MTEKDVDKLTMQTMIDLYNTVNDNIKVLGEDVARIHAPGLISRREVLEGYIKNYAALHFEGMAYSNHMSIQEISETILDQRTI